jgi:PadR family transcriptional regulator PadR
VAMKDQDIRLSQSTLKVLRLFLEKPQQGHSGAEISKMTGIGAGTLYPMLARLEGAGWATSEWEMTNPTETGRPRRRFYKLTAVGQRRANAALMELQFETHQERPVWNT